VCEQLALAQGGYVKVERLGVESVINASPTPYPLHLNTTLSFVITVFAQYIHTIVYTRLHTSVWFSL